MLIAFSVLDTFLFLFAVCHIDWSKPAAAEKD